MIIKQRGIPAKLAGLAALNSRISRSNNMFHRIEAEYKNRRGGFAGEMRVDKFLEELEMKMPYFILNDLHLQVGKKNVQIDTILIHPNFILVMEIKNMRGELYFDKKTGQFYRKNDLGKKEGMRNPEAQLNRSTNAVNIFLQDSGFGGISDGVIVLVSRAGIVMQESEKWKTVTLDYLIEFIETMESRTQRVISDEKCRQLAYMLVNENRKERLSGMAADYNISAAEIKKGVRCPKCHRIPMVRKHSRWHCGNCGGECRTAHLATLQEYRFPKLPLQ